MSCISYECMDIVHKILFMCVNSVSRLCLRLRDTVLEFNLPFDMCRWPVTEEDVDVIHEVMVRHHRLLTSSHLLRP